MVAQLLAKHYRIFDTTLSCDFPLPELPETSQQDDALSIKLGVGTAEQFSSQGFKKVFEWYDLDGTLLSWSERAGDEYLYVFPDSAIFHISAQQGISCFLHEDGTMQLLRHFLLNQIIPRYLGSTGAQMLHAGAVTLSNGKSVAFLGDSGFGKSTLTSSFYQHGSELINDDCIQMTLSESGVSVVGGLGGIRLFPDSLNEVFDEASGFANYMPSSDKQQWFLNSKPGCSVPGRCELDAIFILNDPATDTGTTISLERASGSEAMMAMISSAFSLDPLDKRGLADNFYNIGQALSRSLNIYRLVYPRHHQYLGDVRAAITACLESV